MAPGALRVAATAAAGVIAGHFLGYRLVFPGIPQRHGILIETGHGYLPLGARIAVMLAVVAAAVSVTSGYRRARARMDRRPGFTGVALRLSLLQVLGFVCLEFLERVAAGVPFHHFLLPVLAVGLVAQVAVAAIGAGLLVLLERAGERAALLVAATIPSVPEPAAWVLHERRSTTRRPDSSRSSRGPPALLLQGL